MDWDQLNTELNDSMMAHFSTEVVLHLEGRDPIKGIYDQEGEQAKVKGGGYITRSKTTLSIDIVDAESIECGVKLTVKGKQWMVSKPPKPDGDGSVILELGEVNSDESEPNFRH